MTRSMEAGTSPERVEQIARDWARDNNLAKLRSARWQRLKAAGLGEYELTVADVWQILRRALALREATQSTRALQHVYPQWETPEDDPGGEPREVWRGKMRIVHAQRARKLRRRGVPLMDLRPLNEGGYNAAGRAKYAWFVEPNCERCNDTGLVSISYGGDGYGDRCAARADADEQPCPECGVPS